MTKEQIVHNNIRLYPPLPGDMTGSPYIPFMDVCLCKNAGQGTVRFSLGVRNNSGMPELESKALGNYFEVKGVRMTYAGEFGESSFYYKLWYKEAYSDIACDAGVRYELSHNGKPYIAEEFSILDPERANIFLASEFVKDSQEARKEFTTVNKNFFEALKREGRFSIVSDSVLSQLESIIMGDK